MKKNNHIVIVGAGIVGLTSAALLAQSSFNKKYHIHVIDAGEPSEYKDWGEKNNELLSKAQRYLPALRALTYCHRRLAG
jgi:2-polyprenyl-6-methoxyphenol hydroxylase-like FAD-dependent oxidoreductase